MTNKDKQSQQPNREMPTARAEDVEFSEALADADDLEAVERAEAADRRQLQGE